MAQPVEVLRRATVDDAPAVVEFNKALAKETEDLDLDHELISAGVAALLSDPSKGTYFVAQVGDKVVAQLMITYEWSDWRNSQVWWVQSVYVAPAHRRRGHYKRLYAHVREAAREVGAGGVRLYADNGNERAHRTYEAMGMSSHYRVFEDMFGGY